MFYALLCKASNGQASEEHTSVSICIAVIEINVSCASASQEHKLTYCPSLMGSGKEGRETRYEMHAIHFLDTVVVHLL